MNPLSELLLSEIQFSYNGPVPLDVYLCKVV